LIVQIASFMLRYVHVVGDEMHRMEPGATGPRIRGALGIRSWPRSSPTPPGSLFIRSYERGERVHLAMLSRGYTGRMPILSQQATTLADWRHTLLLPALAACVLVAAWMMQA
jgi:cobalt/nickel transport system permease protein